MAPLVLAGARETMTLWQEEIFASAAVCLIVDSDAEAVQAANCGGYRLTAAIFAEDLRKGLAMAKTIQSG